MKKFGRFPKSVAESYKRILDEKGIISELEESLDQYEAKALGYSNLMIPDEDSEKAAIILSEFELQADKRVQKMSKDVRPQIILLFVILLLGIAVMFIFAYTHAQ